MTDLQQLLFDYAMDTGYSAAMGRAEARSLPVLEDRLSRQLRDELPPEQWDTVEKLRDVLLEQQDLGLEAMFLAALSVCRELP